MFTAAFGMSPAGDLVGTYCDTVGCHAYLLSGGIKGALITIDIPGAVSTEAYGINARGQIVGGYCRTDGTCHGYVREPDGEFITVDPPGSTFAVAFAVDPAGEITGLFCDARGACHAFAAIPEYGSAAHTSVVAPRGAGASALVSTSLDHRGKGTLALSLAHH
jgi:hypothetical protein